MERISVTQASEQKGCSRQAVHYAIKKEQLDADQVGGMGYLVKQNKKYTEWQPNPNRQAAGKHNIRRRKQR